MAHQILFLWMYCVDVFRCHFEAGLQTGPVSSSLILLSHFLLWVHLVNRFYRNHSLCARILIAGVTSTVIILECFTFRTRKRDVDCNNSCLWSNLLEIFAHVHRCILNLCWLVLGETFTLQNVLVIIILETGIFNYNYSFHYLSLKYSNSVWHADFLQCSL